MRQQTLGYVSQFLRVIPRVACLDVVMEPALGRGWSKANAQSRAEHLLTRLNIPQRLWQLAPGTFSGGEQQRVNIARGFMVASLLYRAVRKNSVPLPDTALAQA